MFMFSKFMVSVVDSCPVRVVGFCVDSLQSQHLNKALVHRSSVKQGAKWGPTVFLQIQSVCKSSISSEVASQRRSKLTCFDGE